MSTETCRTTRARSPWELYLLWGVLAGGATGAVAPVLAAMIATRWFAERRGLVTGLLLVDQISAGIMQAKRTAAVAQASVGLETARKQLAGVVPVEVAIPADIVDPVVWVAPKTASGPQGWPVPLAVSELDEVISVTPAIWPS